MSRWNVRYVHKISPSPKDTTGPVEIKDSAFNGDWSWLARPASTVVTPNHIILAFRADYRRNAAQAREDIYRQLEKAIEDTMPEDEAEALLRIYDEKR